MTVSQASLTDPRPFPVFTAAAADTSSEALSPRASGSGALSPRALESGAAAAIPMRSRTDSTDSTIRSAASVEDSGSSDEAAPAPTLFARVCSNISNFFTAIFSHIASFFGNRNEQVEQAPGTILSPLEAARLEATATAAAAAAAVAHRDVQAAEETRVIDAAVIAIETACNAAIVASDAAAEAIRAAQAAGDALAPLMQQEEEELAAQEAAQVALQQDIDFDFAKSMELQDEIQTRSADALAVYHEQVRAAQDQLTATMAQI